MMGSIALQVNIGKSVSEIQGSEDKLPEQIGTGFSFFGLVREQTKTIHLRFSSSVKLILCTADF